MKAGSVNVLRGSRDEEATRLIREHHSSPNSVTQFQGDSIRSREEEATHLIRQYRSPSNSQQSSPNTTPLNSPRGIVPGGGLAGDMHAGEPGTLRKVAYIFAIVIVAVGTAFILTKKGTIGLVVVLPAAYIIHRLVNLIQIRS